MKIALQLSCGAGADIGCDGTSPIRAQEKEWMCLLVLLTFSRLRPKWVVPKIRFLREYP